MSSPRSGGSPRKATVPASPSTSATTQHTGTPTGAGERYTWVGTDGRTANPSANGLDDAYAMAKVGKKKAGRLLDGATHDGFPEPQV